jgi:hypothetical protein
MSTPALQIARSILADYRREEPFDLELANANEAERIGEALKSLGCQVTQEAEKPSCLIVTPPGAPTA